MGVAFDKMHPDGPPCEWIATLHVEKELLEDRDSLSNSLLDHVSESGAHTLQLVRLDLPQSAHTHWLTHTCIASRKDVAT